MDSEQATRVAANSELRRSQYTDTKDPKEPPYTLEYLRNRFNLVWGTGKTVEPDNPELAYLSQKMFDYYDDGTGYMGEHRLTAVARDMGDDAAYDTEAVKLLFREMDADKSGFLDADEFVDALANFITRGYVISPKKQIFTLQQLREMFGVTDSNPITKETVDFRTIIRGVWDYYDDGTGYMGELRLGVVARDFGDDAAYDKDNVKLLFREMDTDRSESLDFDEFLESMATFVNQGFAIPPPPPVEE
eukprot:PhF_6_TR41609/c0_g1_i1/m.63063